MEPAIITAGVAAVVGVWIARWQFMLAKEKLRHDLYDRRFTIYMAFHELLVAIIEKENVEAELRTANAARAHSVFLLNGDTEAYLEELHKEAFRINNAGPLLGDPLAWASQGERSSKAAQLGQDKLNSVIELKSWRRNLSASYAWTTSRDLVSSCRGNSGAI